MGSLTGPKAWREPAGEAKSDVCVISDGEVGAYCTVGLVFLILVREISDQVKFYIYLNFLITLISLLSSIPTIEQFYIELGSENRKLKPQEM
jgi:hypothetical protein